MCDVPMQAVPAKVKDYVNKLDNFDGPAVAEKVRRTCRATPGHTKHGLFA